MSILPANDPDSRLDNGRDLVAKEAEYIVQAKALNPQHPVSKVAENIKSGSAEDGKGNAYTTGICFSGGGIRSAMFSLGIMHRLAQANILSHIDYLSTVSGGGYIGGALTWWLGPENNKDGRYDLADKFPFGTIPPDEPNTDVAKPLKYLLAKGKFLTPGNGIGVTSGVAVVFRAIFLNLLVWIPMAGFLMFGLLALGYWPLMQGLEAMVNMAAPGLLNSVSGISIAAGDTVRGNILPPIFILFVIMLVSFLILFLFTSVVFSIMSWLDHSFSRGHKKTQTAAQEDVGYTGAFIAICRWVGAMVSTSIALGLVAFVLMKVAAILPQALGSPAPLDTIGRLASFDVFALLVVLLVVAIAAVYIAAPSAEERRPSMANIARFTLYLVGAMVIDGLFLTAAQILPSVAQAIAYASALLQFASAVFVALLILMLNGILVRKFLISSKMSQRYGERRLFEQLFGKVLTASVVLLALVSIPVVLNIAEVSFGGGLNGRITLVAGVISALWGFYRTNIAGRGGWATDLVLIAGSVLLLYGIVATGYDLATAFVNGSGYLRGGFVGLLAVAFGTGFLTNLNYISLNRLYRDRIAEAFMPDAKTIDDPTSPNKPSTGSDKLKLCDSWAPEGFTPVGPYHLINTNVILVNDAQAKYALRGGDNYILAPLYSGSEATGWVKTEHLAGGEITIPSAVAASGAAANPNTGMSGRGPSRAFFVSLAMNLLSIRLSYWVPNPFFKTGKLGQWLATTPRAHHFYPNAPYSLFKLGYKKESDWLELSDGGHFENNGLYEMIRRQAGLIIVCDGGQDLGTTFETLGNALERATADFGAKFDFDIDVAGGSTGHSTPEDTIPKTSDGTYPPGAKYADRGYFMARIRYASAGGWNNEGLLIYLKSSMLKSLSPVTKSYKGRFPDFPNQTTADQFFGPDQSNAYRDAGFKAADQMLNETRLLDILKPNVARPARNKLMSNAHWK